MNNREVVHRKAKKIKCCNKKEADRILRANGWVFDRSSSGHDIYKHPEDNRNLSLPNKLNQMLWKGLVRRYSLKE